MIVSCGVGKENMQDHVARAVGVEGEHRARIIGNKPDCTGGKNGR
jgi:hypothetical protein